VSDVDSNTPLLVRHIGDHWSAPAVTTYSQEKHLQQVLAEQPSLLPGVGTSPVAVRELQTGAGPLDLAVIDATGQITLVECKLASNAQIRREIVGQVLDYASSLWRMSFSDFDARWRQRHDGGLGIIESVGAEGEEADAVRSLIEESLATGRFKLVLAVDVINDGLRRIVEFLNDRTATDLSVIAMELRYARHGDVEMLIPTVYGAELARAKAERSDAATSWTEQDVHDYLRDHWPAAAPVISDILDALRHVPGISYFGTRGVTPSMIVRWDGPAGVSWPFVIYTSKQPYVRVNFHWMTAIPDDAKLALAEALSHIDGVAFNAEQLVAKKFLSRPALSAVDVLANDGARQAFIAAMHAVLAGRPSS
jgi:hypothetical protein